MRILLIGGTNNPEAIYHFSDIKTEQLALGFSSLGHIVYMPEESDHHNNPAIIKIPFKYINPYNYHLIIFTRENFIKKFYENYEVVRRLCTKDGINKELKFPIVCAKYGNHYWYKDLYSTIEEFYATFDYHFPQEYNFCKKFIHELERFDNSKIWPSNMAVPKTISFSQQPPFHKDRKILLYIGRLRQNPSRYNFILNFMRGLGKNYKLIIIPGSFNKLEDDTNQRKFSPTIEDNREWLTSKFSSQNNIEVLNPVPWGKHWDYLYHADYGLDFSPSISTKGFRGGNAKLVEYMRAGLPTITEPSVMNSNLISLCNGGVITHSSFNLDEYRTAFSILENTSWNRSEISRIMVESNSWEIRASEIISYIGTSEDTNLSIY